MNMGVVKGVHVYTTTLIYCWTTHNTRNNERDVKSPETKDHAGSGSGHRPVKQFLLKFFKKYFKPPKYQYCTRDHGPDI